MNSAKQVDQFISDWKSQGLSKTEIIVGAAEAELGWCYVWGATGQQCTPAYRRTYAARSSCPAGEVTEILQQCQVTRSKTPVSSCDGCKWFPEGERTLMDDCQGFIKQTAGRAGIRFTGGGCTTMWNADSNWAAKGEIDSLPEQLCCVFWTDKTNPKVKSHIGWYIGDGMMIHCSGSVKKEKLSKKCTHWAIPKGLEGGYQPSTDAKPTLRKGSKGQDVTELQTLLIRRGYDLSPYGADGSFGNKTLAAVQQFQRDNGLTADGVAGSKTWAALTNGEETYYTVTIRHISKGVADAIVKQYGGTMTAEKE